MNAYNEPLALAANVDPLTEGVAPDCQGMNFYQIDRSLQDLTTLYLDDDLRKHLSPHFDRLGELAGNEIDEWSRLADRHAPILHNRTPRGAWQDWVEFHPAYREMEKVAFSEFGFASMIHKSGVLGWDKPFPHTAKFVFQYLFGQSEFSQLCPISATETSATMIKLYGDDQVKEKFLERMITQDMNQLLKGAQFMTERTGGSDVSNLELEAIWEDGAWRLYGEKWFCSCVDGDVAILLARPKGAPAGNKGLALFAMPRQLDDGQRNKYRIVRLKEKLGSRSMASGELVFEGALAYALGDVGAKENRGLKMMMTQVALSRLSHGARAAAMLRRSFNEAMVVAKQRVAFKEKIINKPLLRRQLMKLMVPTEQALSMTLYVGNQFDKAESGDAHAEFVTRILTPAHKYRSCRDAIKVATGAMEVRGGNGYIEDWANAKLVRDAHLGVLWEGTSNINSLDVTTRAVAKVGAHRHLDKELQSMLSANNNIAATYKKKLSDTVAQTIAFVEEVGNSDNQTLARKATNALYNMTTAVLMACEGAELGSRGGDARRLLLSRLVFDHKLAPQDPLAVDMLDIDRQMTDYLLSDEAVSLENANALVAS